MSFTVHHPRIAGVKVEGLSAAERDVHKKAGWVSNDPVEAPEQAGEAPEEAATEAPTSKPKRARKK